VALALVIGGGRSAGAGRGNDAFAWQRHRSGCRRGACQQLLTADRGHGRRACASSGARRRAAVDGSSWLPPILPRVLALDGAGGDDSAAIDRLSVSPWPMAPAGGGAPAAAAGVPARADVPDDRWLRRPRRHAAVKLESRLPVGEADAVDAAGLTCAG
jgi:hypothetical protein